MARYLGIKSIRKTEIRIAHTKSDQNLKQAATHASLHHQDVRIPERQVFSGANIRGPHSIGDIVVRNNRDNKSFVPRPKSRTVKIPGGGQVPTQSQREATQPTTSGRVVPGNVFFQIVDCRRLRRYDPPH
jgi:hypothetical protein